QEALAVDPLRQDTQTRHAVSQWEAELAHYLFHVFDRDALTNPCEIYMGCAGGIDFTSNLPLTREAVPAGFACFKLTLKGLKGGHS
ncbi:hypothetical protein MJN69_27750, partial [Salmonella enterica subsp. enterica serovar Kentucky]|nr:hypothetical protein [Salmonella enterica subsp. enterica serovar Kentucky]